MPGVGVQVVETREAGTQVRKRDPSQAGLHVPSSELQSFLQGVEQMVADTLSMNTVMDPYRDEFQGALSHGWLASVMVSCVGSS